MLIKSICNLYEMIVEPNINNPNQYQIFILKDNDIIIQSYGVLFEFFNLFSIENHPIYITIKDSSNNLIKFNFDDFVMGMELSYQAIYQGALEE